MAWQPDYATSADLKAFLRITDTVDDAQIALAVTAASRAVDHATGRQFGQVATPTAWTYTPVYDRPGRCWMADIADLQTTTGMVVSMDGTTIPSASFTLEPLRATARGRAWTMIYFDSSVTSTGERGCLSITASWGWTSVPTPIKQATLLQASRFLARRDSPYGIAGSPAEGSEMRLTATVDPDVRVMVRPYMRFWAAA